MKTIIAVNCMFFLTAACAGVAFSILATGGSQWWLVMLCVASFLGGMVSLIKSAIENPTEVAEILQWLNT